MGAVTTSITVNITDPSGGATNARCSVEIDSRDDGLNGGRTSFIAGDTVYLLLFKDSNVTLDPPVCSSGDCVSFSTGSMPVKEFLSLANSSSTSTSKPATDLSVSVVAGDASILSSESGRIVTKAESVAVLRAQYTANFVVYKLSNFPESLDGVKEYPIVIFFEGVAI